MEIATSLKTKTENKNENQIKNKTYTASTFMTPLPKLEMQPKHQQTSFQSKNLTNEEFNQRSPA